MASAIYKLAMSVALASGIATASWITPTEKPIAVQNENEETILQEEHDYYTEWLDFVIPKLEYCESRGNRDAVNYDDAKITGYESRGAFQYQPQTFQQAVLKYNILPDAEPAEIMNFWTDYEIQKLATKAILINEPNGSAHWFNCFKSLPKNVEEYKRLK
jgi:hypothetical protein